MAKRLTFGIALGCLALLGGCGGSDDVNFGETGGADSGVHDAAGSGGLAGKGGSAGIAGTGGQAAKGGAAGTGGSAKGGSAGKAGSAGKGGSAGTGGAAGTAGDAGTGGAAGDAGAAGTGAVAGAGGTAGDAGTGGAAGDGGAAGTGGVAGTGGAAGTGGDAGTGGSAGTGGAAGTGGVAGAGGSAGAGGTCGGVQDKCPGAVLTLTGTGTDPRVGQATGDSSLLCSDYGSSCGSTLSSPDGVYQVTPDVSGVMTIDTIGSNALLGVYDPVIYARTVCGDQATELKCNDSAPPTPDSITFTATGGQTYYIFIDAYGGSSGQYKVNVKLVPPACGNGTKEAPEECDDGNLVNGDGCSSLCKLEAAQPVDICPGLPIVLSGSGNQRTGSATGSTAAMQGNYEGICGGQTSNDVVYSVTPDLTGSMKVNLGGNLQTPFDAVLYARATCADAASELSCNDSFTVGDDAIEIQVLAGQTYYLFVDGYNGANGQYTVHVTVDAAVCGNGQVEGLEVCDDGNLVDGDGCNHLCQLEAGNYDKCPGTLLTLAASGSNWVGTASGSTAGVASDYAGSCASTSATSKDAVYQFNSGVGGTVTATLTASSFDNVLYARSGSCTPGTEVACKDVLINGGEIITFSAAANTNYWVFIDGYNGASGTYTLQVTVAPPVCGNGKVEGAEQCDDGNLVDGDGCSHLCQFEVVGNNDVCPGQVLTLAQSGSKWVATTTGTTVNLGANYAGSCGASTAAPDAVFQFNSGPGGTATVSIPVASFDAVLYAHSTPCATGTEIACDDTVGNGLDTITFPTIPNTNYWIFVDGYSTGAGTFTLSLSVTPAACGNGIVDGSEECDDGNQVGNDGCSALCKWEGLCGVLAEAEPNPYSTPQVIPSACGSFEIPAATMPLADADYFKVHLLAGTTLHAWTFVGSPGLCNASADTVLSLWNSPMGVTNESGACTTAGFLQCNDEDNSNNPCSALSLAVTVTGDYLLKVHNYSTTVAIPQYGLLVSIQ